MRATILLAFAALAAAAAHADATCRLGDATGCARACDSGDAHACLVWGNMLVDGVGVAADPARGDVLFVRGCRKGDADSCNAHGVFVRERALDGNRDWRSVLGLFERACDKGSAKGCENAAEILFDGRVDGRSPREGVALLRKSCELDDGAADGSGCVAYGEALKTGRHVDKDPVLAAKWLAKGCRLGVSSACDEAGELGLKVELSAEMLRTIDRRRCAADDVKACARVGARLLASSHPGRAAGPLATACVGEQAGACAALGAAELFGRVQGVVDGAWALLEKACGLDDAASCRRMGDALLVGHFVPRDETLAKKMLKKACHKGDDVACAHESSLALAKSAKRPMDQVVSMVLGKDCKGGDREACAELAGFHKPAKAVRPGVRRIALDDTERACEDDANAHACFKAGGRYARGAAKDDDKARYFFALGCRAGYPRACAEAGLDLEKGRGGPVDKTAALDAFAKGCSLGNAAACSGAARVAKKVGGDAIAHARPILAQACSARVAPACSAAERLE